MGRPGWGLPGQPCGQRERGLGVLRHPEPVAKHARPETEAIGQHPLHPAHAERPTRSPGFVLGRARAIAVVGLVVVVAGGVRGLVLADDGGSAAQVSAPPVSAHVAGPQAMAEPNPRPPADVGGSAGPTGSWPLVPSEPSSRPTTTSAPPAGLPSAGSDWPAILARLDAVRAEAFGLGDVTRLLAVYVEGSRPLERDRAALLDLAETGIRAVGLRLVVDQVDVVRASSDEAVLRVVDRMSGYQLVSSDGSVAETRPGRGPTAWLVTLRGGQTAWRIAAITAA
jgi:hypothetical protein